MAKTLVAYFSASGVTAKLAGELVNTIKADLYEITPAQKYTSEDLDWNNKSSRSSVEMMNPDSRPELGGEPIDISQYDAVYLGFPIWWGVAPHIVNTFLEKYDFSGKTIIPFATSGGSGIGDAAEHLKPSAPGAKIREGKRLGGMEDTEALKVWTDGIEI